MTDRALGVPWTVWAALALAVGFGLLYQAGAGLRASRGARVTGDEPFYLITTHSLRTDGDLDLRDEYAREEYRAFYDHRQPLWHQSTPTADGRILSPHNVGLSLLLLPGYALNGLDGAKASVGLLGGATVALTFLLALRVTGRPFESLAAAVLLGVSAPFFVYATQVYPELPAAAVLLASLLVLLRRGRARGWDALALAAGVLALLWLGSKYGPLAGVLAVASLVRLRWGLWPAFAGALALGFGAYAWFHLTTYGGLTPYAVNALHSDEGNTLGILREHVVLFQRLYRLLGLWNDGEFGLVRWAPALLLAFPGAVLMARRRPREGGLIWALVGTQLLVAAFVAITMRGWWFPGRQMIVVLPLLAAPMAEALAALRARWWGIAVVTLLGAYTAAVTFALARAVSAQEVTLAVNPFALGWSPFRGLAAVFPVYTDFTAATWLLTFGWLAGLAVWTGGIVRLAWRERARPAMEAAPGPLPLVGAWKGGDDA